MNILIPNIGRRGYLVKYIKSDSDFSGKVFVSDCDNTASGLYGINDGAFILPKPVDDEVTYIDALLRICLKYDIKIIIPVIDPEIYILSQYRDRFIEKGIFVSVSTKYVLDICYNKLRMNNFLQANNFDIPTTFDNIDDFLRAYRIGKIGLPVIVKPIYGSGSADTNVVKRVEDVNIYFHDGMIIQEFIEGQEYGADIFNNLKGEPIRCVIKKKISMRSGETDKSITKKNAVLQKKLINLGQSLNHICNLDCDFIYRDNKAYILDLNPRLGGGYPATHEAGVNLLKLTIELANGKNVNADFDDYQENLLIMKEVSVAKVLIKDMLH